MKFIKILIILHCVTKLHVWIRYLFLRKGYFLRLLLCWGVGFLSLTQDELNTFDTRLNIRGNQSIPNDIIIIEIPPQDLDQIHLIKELNYSNDNFFWNKTYWSKILETLKSADPQKLVVAFHFEKSLSFISKSNELFFNEKTTWLDKKFSFLNDDDGVVRKINLNNTENNESGYLFFHSILPNHVQNLKNKFQKINYRGNENSFHRISIDKILESKYNLDNLKNKIIILGPISSLDQKILTPIGYQNQTTIIAHIIDNLLHSRWIKRLPDFWYLIELGLILLFAAFIITHYPQTVALIFLLWLGTLMAALSAWLFDGFYFWTPAVSPLILIATAWIILVGYIATKIEQQNWLLQQEQKYFQELEQLKNNFVSLISHDLKTPIAKIQAIVDRLIYQNQPNTELTSDLKVLRQSSDELNKYVQSVLKVLRVESRDFKINKEVTDINILIEEALTQLKTLAEEKMIQMDVKLEPMFSIEVDITLIKEVIINLIENAIKYTPNQGLIKIRSFEVDDKVFVSIHDNGEGINQEEVDTVWQKFVRGKNQDLKTKGTGLGLYLVRYFIELHGGRVKMESKVSEGTKVEFYLPLDTEAG